jgi:hypothetical protein
MGYGLVNTFIDHLHVVTTNNYKATIDFHTTNHSTLSLLSLLSLSLPGKSSQQWLFLCNVFTRRFLVTNFDNGDSSASVVHWITFYALTFIRTVVPIVKITPQHGPCRKHSPSTVVQAYLPCRCIATAVVQTT